MADPESAASAAERGGDLTEATQGDSRGRVSSGPSFLQVSCKLNRKCPPQQPQKQEQRWASVTSDSSTVLTAASVKELRAASRVTQLLLLQKEPLDEKPVPPRCSLMRFSKRAI